MAATSADLEISILSDRKMCKMQKMQVIRDFGKIELACKDFFSWY